MFPIFTAIPDEAPKFPGSRSRTSDDAMKRLIDHWQTHGTWVEGEINLDRDKSDWAAMSEKEKRVTLFVLSQFLHGEENVERDIEPVLHLKQKQGKALEAKFLESFMGDEAKHANFFRRYLVEVVNDPTIDLDQYRLSNYAAIFDDALPTAMNRLKSDNSAKAQAIALTTYNLVCEGIVAETAYKGIFDAFNPSGKLPGLCEALSFLKKDEARHIAYGVYALKDLVQEHGVSITVTIAKTMATLVPKSIGVVNEIFDLEDPFPFALDRSDFIKTALRFAQSRIGVITSKKFGTAEEILAALDIEAPEIPS